MGVLTGQCYAMLFCLLPQHRDTLVSPCVAHYVGSECLHGKKRNSTPNARKRLNINVDNALIH